jgi:putative zinc finger protein
MAGDCPEPEMLAAYMERVLSPDRLWRMEEHLVRCRVCRQVLMLAIKSKDVVPDPIPSDPFKP